MLVAGQVAFWVFICNIRSQYPLANLLSSGYFAQPDAFERVIYFDPARTDYTLEFNVLRSRLLLI